MFVSLMFIWNEIAVDRLFIHLRSSLITLVFSITYNRWYVYTSMLHYPSLFSWIFRLKWQREIGTLSPPPTGDRALSPLGWATGSCRPLGGRQAPLFFFLQGLRCKFEEKKLHLSPVAPHRATGVYFWNFPKPTYIFEILIFLNIKKKKPQSIGSRQWLF